MARTAEWLRAEELSRLFNLKGNAHVENHPGEG
jgi:hypothetical protein